MSGAEVAKTVWGSAELDEDAPRGSVFVDMADGPRSLCGSIAEHICGAPDNYARTNVFVDSCREYVARTAIRSPNMFVSARTRAHRLTVR